MARPLRLKRKQGCGSSSNLPTSDNAFQGCENLTTCGNLNSATITKVGE